jgi:hypothetical protein
LRYALLANSGALHFNVDILIKTQFPPSHTVSIQYKLSWIYFLDHGVPICRCFCRKLDRRKCFLDASRDAIRIESKLQYNQAVQVVAVIGVVPVGNADMFAANVHAPFALDDSLSLLLVIWVILEVQTGIVASRVNGDIQCWRILSESHPLSASETYASSSDMSGILAIVLS